MADAQQLTCQSSSNLLLSTMIYDNRNGEAGDVVLFGHATGFCKEIWIPIINKLVDSGLKAKFIAFDLWNHGHSATLNSGRLPLKCKAS